MGRATFSLLLILTLFLSAGENPVQKKVAANGMIWIFQKDDSSKISCVVLLIRGGQNAVAGGKSGLAYLTTRLAVEIPDEGKLRNLMSQATRLTVQTKEDFSLIGIQCLSQNLEETLKTVLRIVKAPLFSALRINAVKINMIHQGNADQDDPANLAHFEALKAFFGPAGPGAPVWGTEESLKSIQKRDIVNFYEKRFTAANMVLSIVSDQKESVIEDLIDKCVSSLKPGTPVETKIASLIENSFEPRFLEKDIHQSYVGAVFPFPALGIHHYALIYLTENILGGGVGSRLWALRAKEKLAYDVNSSFSWLPGNGLLDAYLETSPEKVDQARESLRLVIEKLANDGLTDEELSISQKSACASFWRDHEGKESRAVAMAEFEALGLGFDFPEKFQYEIQSIGIVELNAYLKKVLSPARCFEIVIGPKR